MTKQHFYLIRGLVREKGHWGDFHEHLKVHFPNSITTAIDIPGAGEYFRDLSPLTIGEMVEKMRQDYLAARTPDEESYLISISLGGMISVEWMKRYPNDFLKATLMNTSMGGISPVHHRLKPSAFLHLLKIPCQKGRDKEASIIELICNNRAFYEETLELWDKIQKQHPVSLNNSLRQLFAAATYMPGNFRPPIPVQLLAATGDRMVNVSCSRKIAEKWGIPLIEHPTAGHDLTVDDSPWVSSKIKEFIAP